MESICIPCHKLNLDFSLYNIEDYNAHSCYWCDTFFCDECFKSFLPINSYFGVQDVCVDCFNDDQIQKEERKQKQIEEEANKKKKRKRKRHKNNNASLQLEPSQICNVEKCVIKGILQTKRI